LTPPFAGSNPATPVMEYKRRKNSLKFKTYNILDNQNVN
jgi:hypothetical protein